MSHLSSFPAALQTAGPPRTEVESEVEAILLALKAAAIRAAERSDVAFYADLLTEDAIVVTPAGAFSKARILADIQEGQRYRSSRIEDSRVLALSDEAGLVTYRAQVATADGPPAEYFVSGLYRKYADGWKGVFFQYTPLAVKS